MSDEQFSNWLKEVNDGTVTFDVTLSRETANKLEQLRDAYHRVHGKLLSNDELVQECIKHMAILEWTKHVSDNVTVNGRTLRPDEPISLGERGGKKTRLLFRLLGLGS